MSWKICEFPLYVAVNPKNPLSRKETLRLQDLENQTLINLPEIFHTVKRFEEVCSERGITFKKREITTDYTYSSELVCRNRGVMPLAGYALRQQERLGLVCRRLDDDQVKWELYAAWRKEDGQKPEIREFLSEVFEISI